MDLVIPAWSLTYHQTQHNNLGSVVLFYLLHLLPLIYQTILPLESRSVSEMLFFLYFSRGYSTELIVFYLKTSRSFHQMEDQLLVFNLMPILHQMHQFYFYSFHSYQFYLYLHHSYQF